ncbi:MAG: serine hydrolase domain-containing protein, partial [Anaerolineae bacterium]
MKRNLSRADAVVREALDRVFPAAQVEVRQSGEVLWSAAYGWLDPETRTRPTTADTLFDLASVTKLFVVTAFMTLVEEGRVGLDQPVAAVLPEFTGERPIRPYDDPLKPGALVAVTWTDDVAPQVTSVDAGRVTFRHLLTHTSGLPAWRPLYREGSAEAARRAALSTYFSYPTGARVVYSDIGLILLGMALERLTGQPLDTVVAQRVTGPLGLRATRYLR